LTKALRRRLGFEGYFDLYNVPFQHFGLYNFTERKSPLRPNGMNHGTNIFDFLQQNNVPYFGSDPDQGEVENYGALLAAIETGDPDFTFSYWPALDGLLHQVGNQSPEIAPRLKSYEQWIQKVCQAAKRHYQEVHLYVFGDHGMANCDRLLDLKAKIEALPLRMGKDYAVVYDSTMARFWFFNERARREIAARLGAVPEGRILSDDELRELRVFFPDRYFGELFFLCEEGTLIVPSHMGERPIRAMHGYHPNDKHSFAALFSNQEIPQSVTAIPHVFNLMTDEALLAKEANHRAAGVVHA
jgi:predicted AlkP superfamily pyrophosphatase or phosphodiesterase